MSNISIADSKTFPIIEDGTKDNLVSIFSKCFRKQFFIQECTDYRSNDARSMTEIILISGTISNDSENHEAYAQLLNSATTRTFNTPKIVSTLRTYSVISLCFTVISYLVFSSYILPPTYADMPITLIIFPTSSVCILDWL